MKSTNNNTMNIMSIFRNSKLFKVLSVYMAVNFLLMVYNPQPAMALTGGPSQPEVNSFTPAGASDMVNPYTGDFSYNIPLLDVGGYPINLAYSSGITMDQEASCVGLGWTINTGAITRNMRTIPDEFRGDQVTREINMKPMINAGLTIQSGTELFGAGLNVGSAGLSVKYSNYDGFTFGSNLSVEDDLFDVGESAFVGSLNLTSGPEGLSLSPSVGLSSKVYNDKAKQKFNLKSSVGLTFNSRQGMTNLSINSSIKGGSKNHNGGTGGGVSFVNSTYVPQVQTPMNGVGFTFDLKPGPTMFAGDFEGSIKGYFNERHLEDKTTSVNAYGYMFNSVGAPQEDVMLDFNREKDRPFSRHTTNLPVTNFSYDVYNVSAQGLSGSFRAHQSTVGYVHDQKFIENSGSANVELEFGVGNLASAGTELALSYTDNRSGVWRNKNNAIDLFFGGATAVDDYHEPYYYQQIGELIVDDNSFLDKVQFQAASPIQIPIINTAPTIFKADDDYVSHLAGTAQTITAASTIRSERKKRNLAIYELNRIEAEKTAVSKEYVPSNATLPNHHPAEYTLLQSDGSRYIFGLPALNHTQREVSFNVEGRTYDPETGLVTYVSGEDNSLDNKLGQDHYFDATTLPVYAHSYMLTTVVSHDYSDVDGTPGPSPDDFGTYTKFNYGSLDGNGVRQPDVANYQWRVPFQEDKASWNEGLKSKGEVDDRANYTYGIKDLWYVNSIESKTHVAVFTYENRADGWGVQDENGGKGSETMKRLTKIELHSRPDYDAGNTTKPIKTVHFVYDYSLCQNIPNTTNTTTGEKGKLTLKEVYFTYEGSLKHERSPYVFNYSDVDQDGTIQTDEKHDYDSKGYDMWGCYQPNDGSDDGSDETGVLATEYPYATQDQEDRDNYSAAWSLTSIQTPTGGLIKVHYESDDYAMVQNKNAMNMVNIVGVADDVGDVDELADMSDDLYKTGVLDKTANRYMFFDVPDDFNADSVQNTYCNFNDGDLIHFRFLLSLINTSNSYDYVSGYAKFDDAGIVVLTSGDRYGWLRLHNVNLGDREDEETGKVHPIAKAGWNYGRLHNPRMMYEMQDPDDSDVGQLISSIASTNIITQIVDLFRGANRKFRSKKFSRTFNKTKSWVRLYNPDGKKLGGNCRVSKVTITDDWNYNTNTAHADFDYGMEYTYELADGRSSGIASWEPLMSKENPFVQPVFFSTKKLLAPDDRHYMELPFGESFMPSPTVGYRRVVMRNLQRGVDANSNGQIDPSERTVKRTATGYTINEYYTSYDFPTITNQTKLDIERTPRLLNAASQLLSLRAIDFVSASQGYVVEKFDDFYGKPKSVRVYGEDQETPISGSDYKYFKETTAETINVGADSYTYNVTRPSNKVLTIEPDGSITDDVTVGVDVDIINDFREHKSNSGTVGVNGNLAAFLAGILPLAPFPVILPLLKTSETRFRSAVTTKVVNRYAVLREVVAHDLGASVSTENLAWDSETGGVLLTKTTNEFSDEIFSFSYPVHWAYEHMGQAAKNIKRITAITTDANGVITAPTDLENGEEVLLHSDDTRYWVVYGTDGSSNTGQFLVDHDGTEISTSMTAVDATIVRSGFRNQQTGMMGSITLKDDPTRNNSGTLRATIDFSATDPDNDQILQSEVIEYSEDWKTICGTGDVALPGDTATICSLTDIGEEVVGNAIPTTYKNNNRCFQVWEPGTYNVAGGCNPYTGFIDCFVSTTDLTADFPNLSIVGNINDLETTNTNGPKRLICDYTLPNGTTVQIEVVSTCDDLWECDEVITVPHDYCGYAVTDEVNPYVHNLRGVFRPLRNQLFLGERTQTLTAMGSVNDANENHLNSRTDGHFSSFDPYWEYDSGDGIWEPDTTAAPLWTWASEVTEHLPYSPQVENRDALYRYSAELVGYNHSLPIAVGNNTSYQQIGFDGFEDYDYLGDCVPKHFDDNLDTDDLTEDEAHTGRFSYAIQASSDYTITTTLQDNATSAGSLDIPYTLKDWDCLKGFAPQTYDLETPASDKARWYVFSYWVKEPNTSNVALTDYTNHDFSVSINSVDITSPAVETNKGVIMDGWQRIEKLFFLSAGASGTLDINIENDSSTDELFIDDVRIHPLNSSFKSFVYDPESLRLWAELDNNNFATLYEYDEQGHLARIKKETIRGVVTVQENRTSVVKKGL
jgi:hypothetical protein